VKKYVMDSFAMIAFFEDEPGSDSVAGILEKLLRHEIVGFMSVINWGEVYYSVAREQGMEEAEKVLVQLNRYPLQLVEADKALTYSAAGLKAVYPIAYADCFAAALTSRLKATLVTGDPEFRRLEDRISIQWI
jgi:predicted nucleic acid-binding protein